MESSDLYRGTRDPQSDLCYASRLSPEDYGEVFDNYLPADTARRILL